MKRSRTQIPVLLFLALGTIGAFAQTIEDWPYLDDRSDAQMLVTSYYSAIARHEFARAWSYWHDGVPGQSYEAFRENHEDIHTLNLVIGDLVAEGAAGSAYYSVPVAVEISHDNTSVEILAGCFLARLAEPTIQEPPFRPMHLERMRLKPAKEPHYEQVPEVCDLD